MNIAIMFAANDTIYILLTFSSLLDTVDKLVLLENPLKPID